MSVKTIIVSAKEGRAKAPQVQEAYFSDRSKRLSAYGAVLWEMFSEPLLADDTVRPKNLEQLVSFLVQNCETLICKEDANVVGIGIFYAVFPGRTTQFIGWIAPEYRKRGFKTSKMIHDLWQDMISYGFDRLGVARVEVRCSEHNYAAAKFAIKAGFDYVGRARLDFLMQGRLYDTLIFDCINPAFQVGGLEELENVRRHKRIGASGESVSNDVGGQQSQPERQSIPASERGLSASERDVQPRSYHDVASEHAIEREPAERSPAGESSRRESAELSSDELFEPAVRRPGATAGKQLQQSIIQQFGSPSTWLGG